MEVKLKHEARPVFCKPRPVPLAFLEDLNDAYEDKTRKRVWKPTDFNAYGTPRGSSAKGNQFRTEQGQDQGLQELLSTVQPRLSKLVGTGQKLSDN